ncbi:MAG TPA: hypothetical protein VII41_17675, partial [Steroidobacteraceae bacterium]
VLIRQPFRVTFSFAGPDKVWQPNWRGQARLPDMIRIAVRDSATGQLLAVSGATIVHVNAAAECAQTKDGAGCATATAAPDKSKKEQQL